MAGGLSGFITGALMGASGAVADVAEGEVKNQQKAALEKQLADIYIEKDQRIKELDMKRNIGEEERKRSPEYLKAEAEAGKTKQELELQTRSVLAGKKGEVALTETKAGEAAATEGARIKGKTEAVEETTKVNQPGYLAGVAKETAAKESSYSKTAAAGNAFELDQKKTIADLRTELSNTKDEAKRTEIQTKINDLTSLSNTKSFADMATVGNGFRIMADNLREDAKKEFNKDKKTELLDRARDYEDQAASIFSQISSKRLGETSKAKGNTSREPAIAEPANKNRRPLGAFETSPLDAFKK